jgi:YD repeat-containing protein
LATEARLTSPHWIALDGDGNLYISTNQRIRKVTPSGIITTVAGTGSTGFSGDGGPAIQARLSNPRGITIDEVGNLYISESNRIRRVSPDGIINTIAGTGGSGFAGDGGPAALAMLRTPSDVGLDAAGNLYIVDSTNNRIRKIPKSGLFQLAEERVASQSGEQQFVFDHGGRHLRTLNTLTGATEYEFQRDSEGRLISISDVDGDITLIERNASGDAVAIIAPDSQRTDLTLDANGYLRSATNPAGERYAMTYTAGGLLTEFRDRRDQPNTFEYDALGRLIRDINAGLGGWELSRTELTKGYRTTMTTAEERGLNFTVEPQSNGDRLQINTQADGSVQQRVFKMNSQEITTQPDGTVITTQEGPDSRFGMHSPVLDSVSVRLPSGLTSTVATDRSTTLTDPNDPLSLQSLTETRTVNGRAFVSNYAAASRTFTFTTPAGRTRSQVINEQTRPVSTHIAGLAPVNFEYDTRGRLNQIITDDGAEVRNTQLNYYSSGHQAGFLQSITDAEDRITRQILPHSQEILYSYDANGNLTSITPPGRPAHVFNYNAFDLEDEYTPPVLPDVSQPATVYDYNLDKELIRIVRPDGQEINFNYNGGAQLTSMVIPTGTYSYTYIPTSGQLDTVTSPDNIVLDYSYNGFLLTGQTWTGTIAGSVTQGYDTSFRVNTQSVNGMSVAFAYDNDDLLTQAIRRKAD